MISSHRSSKCSIPVSLTWTHGGVAYRLTPWPEAAVECRYGDDWVPVAAAIDVLGAAVAAAGRVAWRSYLEFVPLEVREFLGAFRANRVAALQVAARCPALLDALAETPALVPFIAAHAALRGMNAPRWHELNAVFERGGLFSVLEWLGLPASRQTLAILRNVVAPDLVPALLEPLRATLWQPDGVFALAKMPAITDRDLTRACLAMAA